MRIPRDLFRKPIRTSRTKLEIELSRYDAISFLERLERLKYVARVMPRDYVFSLPPETWHLFNEAKETFVHGSFVATVMLSAAFIEHILSLALTEKGLKRDTNGGMQQILRALVREGSALTPVVPKLVRLQEIRNPFVHLKPFSHPSRLTHRMLRSTTRESDILEIDGREALSLMYTVASRPVW